MSSTSMSKSDRRIVSATLVGTTIEWYDFFIYSNAAALVFGPLFFSPLGAGNATLLAFATVGISFFFRPLGAIIAGYLGDKFGRRAMLVATLFLMGGATVGIGLLPTYAQIGVGAPILLVILRILQGFSAGGEWGGAALMAVEHAAKDRRGFFGAFPQMGVPIGMLLATGVLSAISALVSAEQFLAWGWRIPFLLSVVLFVVGMVIRAKVSESPVFEELRENRAQSAMPLVQLFRTGWRQVILCAVLSMSTGVAGYMSTGGYLLSYATGVLQIDRASVLNCILVASAVWIFTTLGGGILSDRLGRKSALRLGYWATLLWAFPFFWLVDSRNIVLLAVALVVLAIGMGLSYGPQSSTFAEVFPARIRYSGISIGYALGAILGGAFAPTIATWLQSSTNTSASVAGYLAVFAAFGLIAATLMKDRTGAPLNPAVAGIDPEQGGHEGPGGEPADITTSARTTSSSQP